MDTDPDIMYADDYEALLAARGVPARGAIHSSIDIAALGMEREALGLIKETTHVRIPQHAVQASVPPLDLTNVVELYAQQDLITEPGRCYYCGHQVRWGSADAKRERRPVRCLDNACPSYPHPGLIGGASSSPGALTPPAASGTTQMIHCAACRKYTPIENAHPVRLENGARQYFCHGC